MTNTYTTTIRWRACRNPNGTYIHIDTAEAAIAWAKRQPNHPRIRSLPPPPRNPQPLHHQPMTKLHRHKWHPVWHPDNWFHQGTVTFVCHCGAHKQTKVDK
jgi:hypothetical protein